MGFFAFVVKAASEKLGRYWGLLLQTQVRSCLQVGFLTFKECGTCRSYLLSASLKQCPYTDEEAGIVTSIKCSEIQKLI